MVKVIFVLAASVLAGCAYDTHFEDCSIQCSADSGCPDGLTCGAEGLCRSSGVTATCTAVLGTRPSCEGLAPICGPDGNDDCCSTALPIPGGTFDRGYDVAADGLYSDESHPATVSAFVLDKYEVTVGRFRKFVEGGGGTQANPPVENTGAHPKIFNSGWSPSWNSELVSDTSGLAAAVQCDSLYQTWTISAVANEDLPINCVTWYEAQAFCIWDGGYLPTEEEWNYAAAGGDEQRAYPWSIPAGTLTANCSMANYQLNGSTYCMPGVGGPVATMNRVGSESPAGDGKWKHSDLAGNAWEWTLDWYAAYVDPCDDCANLMTSDHRVIRGGNFSHTAQFLRTADRGLTTSDNSLPSSRTRDVGFRCAR